MNGPMSWHSFPVGFAAAASLVAAVGPQNAYVLRLGLGARQVFQVVLLCIAADAILVAAGVFGLGSFIAASPTLLAIARWGGAAFLAVYGFIALRRSLLARSASLAPSRTDDVSCGRTLLTTLGFTFLNPLVYVDTVVLLGVLGGAEPAAGRVPFGIGATTASALWFVALGYGARRLAPVFARRAAWRWLDAGTAMLMLVLATDVARSA
jgi:L-lysine exporter family protein LysE/ArgO